MLVLILGVMVWIILCTLHGGPLGSSALSFAPTTSARGQ